jgi:hypothetical protein
MGRWPVGVVLAIAAVAAACAAGTSSAHPNGCHADRTCPSDDHSYVWSGMSCASDPAARLPEDQLPIDHGGVRYWCHVVVDRQMTPRPARAPAACRVDRGALRTLSDTAAARVRPTVTVTTVSSLAALPRPGSVAGRASGAERTRYRLRGRLVSATVGPAAELRVVLADPDGEATIAVVFRPRPARSRPPPRTGARWRRPAPPSPTHAVSFAQALRSS